MFVESLKRETTSVDRRTEEYDKEGYMFYEKEVLSPIDGYCMRGGKGYTAK